MAINKLVSQAKDSLKLLEVLQKEGLERAKALIPSKEETKQMTNDRIVASLKRLGFATRSEVRALEEKVEALAKELRTKVTKIERHEATENKTPEANA